MNNIDFELLRTDLLNYFCSLAFNVNMGAIIEAEKVRTAKYSELIDIAYENGFNIEDYKIKVLRY